MAKRLIKVAKDLNVRISTLVEYLQKEGFEVENSPRTKITDEVYEVLLRGFEKQIAIKSQQDQLIIGSRIKRESQTEQEKERKRREDEARIRKEEERKKYEEEKRIRKELERLKAEQEAGKPNTSQEVNADALQLKSLKIKGKINLDDFKKPRKKRVDNEKAELSNVRRLREKRRNRRERPETEKAAIEIKANINHIIYKALHQEKKLTESYIGSIPFQWNYTIAHYTAELTKAVDFTLFDKVICGILQLDEVASLEAIGTILGMNVVNNPDEKQYLDPAEREILVAALQLLEEYEMITTGDTYYSRCRLTETGKEYAQKGRKFKVTNDVPFTLYFDDFSNQHESAQQRFQNLTGTRSNFEQDLNLLDEDLVREVAEVQQPNIYNQNPEKLRSFRYVELDEQKTQNYSVELYACLVVDAETQTYRIEVYVPQLDKIDTNFSTILNKMIELKEYFMLQFLQRFHFPYSFESNFLEHHDYLIKQQKELSLLLENKEIKKAQSLVKSVYSQSKFIDKTYFINNLEIFVNKDYQEIWLIFDEVDKTILDNLNSLIRTFNLPIRTTLFIVIPNDIEIFNKKPNIWIFNTPTIEETRFFFRQKNDFDAFVTVNYPIKTLIDETETMINHQVFERKDIDVNLEADYYDIKNKVVENCLSEKVEVLIEICTNIDHQEITKQSIFDFQQLSKIFHFINEDKYQNFSSIKNFKEVHATQLNTLKRQLLENTEGQLNELNKVLSETEFKKLEEFETIAIRLENIKENLFPTDEKSNNLFRIISELTEQKKQALKDELVKKTYIIDTNVFIEEPNILDWIIGRNYAVVSGKVVDELDNLKKKSELRSKVNRAIRSIKIAQNKRQIKINFGDKTLLPDSFDGRLADNLILSVAIMYKNKEAINPVLLTSDNAFQVKANMLDIRTIDLETFLEENPKIEIEKLQKEEVRKPKNQEDNNRNKAQHNNRRRRKTRKPKKR
jgi:hypothetical protein